MLAVRYAITATLLMGMLALSTAGETSHSPLPDRPRLAELLRQEVPNAPAPPVEVETTITSYERLNDASYFVLGYYTVNPKDPNSLTPPLRVLLLDKRSNSWRHLVIQGKPDDYEDPKNWCAGGVTHVQPIGEKFFLDTHVTPSASCQFVLSHTLKLEHILFGWPTQVPSSNDKSNAVAMHVQYIGEGMGPRAENFKADVIYVFDLSGKTIQHREFKPDVLEKMIGKCDIEKLTQPSVLRRLFSSQEPR